MSAHTYTHHIGACVQILLFGILSIEIKRKAPRAHTVCEIIGARYAKKYVNMLIVMGLIDVFFDRWMCWSIDRSID